MTSSSASVAVPDGARTPARVRWPSSRVVPIPAAPAAMASETSDEIRARSAPVAGSLAMARAPMT